MRISVLRMNYLMLQPRMIVVLSLIGIITIIIIKQFYLFTKIQSCANSSCPASAPCCSKWGFCGSTTEHCGVDCQSGPCIDSNSTNNANDNSTSIITITIFQCAFPLLNATVVAQRFQGFKEAKWSPVNKDEAAIFLSHVSHETDGLKTYVEYCQRTNSCNNYQNSWCSIKPISDRQYYGRGWFQLSYPCNYWNAGKALNLDLLSNPDLVAESDRTAAATAIWYYKATEMNEPASRGDFANTTRILNKYECNGNPGQTMQKDRVTIYQRIRKCFGLQEATNNLYC